MGAHQAVSPGFYRPIFLEAGQIQATLDGVLCVDRVAMSSGAETRNWSSAF